MSHTITISPSLSKEEKYKSLIPQIKSLAPPALPEGKEMISVRMEGMIGFEFLSYLSNICAALKYNMDNFFWVGFYFVKDDELIVGPYQGPVACTRIKLPQGVCGTSVAEKRTVVVDDVNKFPGHIACSAESKSEIAVPIIKNDKVIAVLDVDSNKFSSFDDTDRKYLEQLAVIISELITP